MAKKSWREEYDRKHLRIIERTSYSHLMDQIDAPFYVDYYKLPDIQQALEELFAQILEPREKEVIARRHGLYGQPVMTYKAIGEIVDLHGGKTVTGSVISRIEERAIKKLKRNKALIADVILKFQGGYRFMYNEYVLEQPEYGFRSHVKTLGELQVGKLYDICSIMNDGSGSQLVKDRIQLLTEPISHGVGYYCEYVSVRTGKKDKFYCADVGILPYPPGLGWVQNVWVEIAK